MQPQRQHTPQELSFLKATRQLKQQRGPAPPQQPGTQCTLTRSSRAASTYVQARTGTPLHCPPPETRNVPLRIPRGRPLPATSETSDSTQNARVMTPQSRPSTTSPVVALTVAHAHVQTPRHRPSTTPVSGMTLRRLTSVKKQKHKLMPSPHYLNSVSITLTDILDPPQTPQTSIVNVKATPLAKRV